MTLIAYVHRGSDTKAHCTLDTFVACFSLSLKRSIRCSAEKQNRSGNPDKDIQRVTLGWQMWTLTSKSHFRCYLDGMMAGVISKFRSIRRVGRLDRCARGDWGAYCVDLDDHDIPEAIRMEKINYADLLTKQKITARGAGAEALRLLRAEYAGHLMHGW